MYAARAQGPAGPIMGEQVPTPRPAPGEALVAVHAVAITAGELSWPERWPAIPGHEISGTVAALGEGVTGVAAGQPVYGLVGFDRNGGAADYVTLPAADLSPKPGRISHAGAASLALAALTAWQALVTHARVTAGQQVLVNGAAGGVGTCAVQLARALGARVTATASAADAEFVAGLGADEVIDYAGPPIAEAVTGVDVVVDTAGGEALSQCWDTLRPGGVLVGVATAPDEDEARRHHVRSVYFIVEPDGPQLVKLAQLVDAGQLRSSVGQEFPLAEASAAFDALEHQHIRGKVVLSVRPEPPGSEGS